MQAKLIDATTERALRLFIDRIALQHDLAGAYLFGSRARGTHQPDSDADVAVLLRGEHGRFLQTKLATCCWRPGSISRRCRSG
jgi:predicted nucleotidyltransferase